MHQLKRFLITTFLSIFLLVSMIISVNYYVKNVIRYLDIPIAFNNGLGNYVEITGIDISASTINVSNKNEFRTKKITDKNSIKKIINHISCFPLKYTNSRQIVAGTIIIYIEFKDDKGKHLFDFTITSNNEIHDSRSSKTYKPYDENVDIADIINNLTEPLGDVRLSNN